MNTSSGVPDSQLFGLEVDGVTINGITEISGLKADQEVVENMEAGSVRRLPGRPLGGEVSMTRGLDEDKSFERWVTELRSPGTLAASARKDCGLLIYSREGRLLRRVQLLRAWPKSLEFASTWRDSRMLVAETLNVVFDDIDWLVDK